MLEYQKILQLMKQGKWHWRDKNGDTLLHHLMRQEECFCVPERDVALLLRHNPDAVNIENKDGFVPAQVLEVCQNSARISNRPVRRLLYKYMADGPKKIALKDTIRMTFYEQFIFQNETDFQKVNVTEQLFQKPTVVFFSGRGSFVQSLIVGAARLFLQSLNLAGSNMPAVSWICAKYPGSGRDLYNDYATVHLPITRKNKSDHPIQYVQSFVAEQIRPLYLDEKKQKRPESQIMKNIRRINLVGYSYGSSVIQMLADCMTADMMKYHFSAAAIQRIQSQIPALLIGPYVNDRHYANHFRSYHMINTHDEVGYEKTEKVLKHLPNENDGFIQTVLKGQRHQKAFVVNDFSYNTDYAGHHLNTYFSLANNSFKTANAWKNCVVYNMVNNAVQNENSRDFIPLPKDLDTVPSKLLFVKDRTILSSQRQSFLLLNQKKGGRIYE